MNTASALSQAAYEAAISKTMSAAGRQAAADEARTAFWAQNPCGFPRCPKHSKDTQ